MLNAHPVSEVEVDLNSFEFQWFQRIKLATRKTQDPWVIVVMGTPAIGKTTLMTRPIDETTVTKRPYDDAVLAARRKIREVLRQDVPFQNEVFFKQLDDIV